MTVTARAGSSWTGRRLRLGLVVGALSAAASIALASPGTASAQYCAGSSKLVNRTDVQVSWHCDFESPEFWIVGSEPPVEYVNLDYVSGFAGFECRLADERDFEEFIEVGSEVKPILDCSPSGHSKGKTEQPEGEGQAIGAQASSWTGVYQSSGTVRTSEPACTGPSPLHLKVWALEVPDPEWSPSDGFELSWLRRFQLSEPCGASEGSAWIYADPAQTASKSGSVKALFSCTLACRVIARGKIRVPTRSHGRASAARATTIRLKKIAKTLSANQTRVFRWKLTRSQRKRLGGHRSTATITATSIDATGAKAVLIRRVKLR